MKGTRGLLWNCARTAAVPLVWLAFACPDVRAQYEDWKDMSPFTQKDRMDEATANSDSIRKANQKKERERGDLMQKYGMTWKEAEAYQVYKEYRGLREEIAKQRGFAKGERDEANDSVYNGSGSYGGGKYKSDAAQNVNAAEQQARSLYDKSRQLDQMWRAAGYDKVYGTLTDSDQYPIKRTDGTRTDLVEAKLLSNRLDPADQKFTDWIRSQPDDIGKIIKEIPPGGEYFDQLKQEWQLGEYRKVADALKNMEESGLIKIQKGDDGDYSGAKLDYAKIGMRPPETESDAGDDVQPAPEGDSPENEPGAGEEPEAGTSPETGDDKNGVSNAEPAAGTEPETPTPPESPSTDAVSETAGEAPATSQPEGPAVNEPENPPSSSGGTSVGDGSGNTPDSDTSPEGDESEGDQDGGSSASDSDSGTGDKPGETTTSSGYVEDSNGRTTLTETRGADGSLIRTTTTDTDKDGNVTGKTTYEGGTGEGKTSPGDDGLRGAEPEADTDVNSDMVSGGYNSSENLNTGWAQGQTERGEAGNLTMAQNTQMGEAANVGNQTISDAGNVRDTGGRDSQTIREGSARDTAKNDRQNSWGKALGDAVEQGVTEGGKAFGGALGGAAADQAVGAIFGSPDDENGSDEDSGAGSGETTTASTPAGGDSSKGKDSPKKDNQGKSDDSSGNGCTDGDSGNGGGSDTGLSSPSDDPLGVTGTSKNDDGTVTIRYGCGYSWTGKPPGPSRCPICSRETVSTENNPPADSGGTTDTGDTGNSGDGEPTDPTLTPAPAGYSGDTGSAPDASGTEPSGDINCPFAGPTENPE